MSSTVSLCTGTFSSTFNESDDLFPDHPPVIMPTSALARLSEYRRMGHRISKSSISDIFCSCTSFLPAQMDIASPYLFELKTHNSDKKTHAGVIEFIAEPGNVHLPAWVSGNQQRCEPSPR